MELKHEKLSLFFDRVKTLTFWQRLFGWASFKTLSYEAYSEFITLISSFESITKDAERVNNDKTILENDCKNYEKNHAFLTAENARLKEEISRLNLDNVQLRQENTTFKVSGEEKQNEYEKKVAKLTEF